MRSAIALLCLSTAPATAGDSGASISVASEHAWSGLAGRDAVRPTPPAVELGAVIPVIRWLSFDAKLVWSRDVEDVAAGARFSVDTTSVVVRGSQAGGFEIAAGAALGERLELELGLTGGDRTDLLLKAAVRY